MFNILMGLIKNFKEAHKPKWVLWLVIIVAILCLIGIGYLWILAGKPDNMFWRFQK